MPHALLNPDGSIAQQVFDYDPERDNPGGVLRAVKTERFGDPQTHDLDPETGRWRANAAKRQASERIARRATMTQDDLIDRIEVLEAEVAALKAKAGLP